MRFSLKHHSATTLLLLAASGALLAQNPTENTDDAPPPPASLRPAPKPAAKPQAPAGTATTPTQATGTSETPAHSTPHPATTAASAAASLPSIPINRNVIVLDAGHGGVDSGSRIGDSIVEKNVTLALAFKLRSLLTSRGFTVVMTRDSDAAMEPNSPSTPLTLDDRAGIANHPRAVACLLLHATGAGTGVHLYTSEIQAADGEAALQPWLTAQAPWVVQSGRLAKQMAAALDRSHIALVNSTASVRPVDSMACPAVVVELAPSSSDESTIEDATYLQHVSEALAGAMVVWQSEAQAPTRILPPPPAPRPAPPSESGDPQGTTP